MKYNYLGKTSLKVSELCLGTMIFGESSGRSADKPTSLNLIDRFIDAGGNFIDTANVYGDGASEKIVGEAIQGRRDDLVVATKFRFGTGDQPNDQGLSRKYILNAVEQSLQRLNTDYIDLYYIHATQIRLPFEEFMGTLNQLVQDGKIRYIGVSNFRAWEVAKANMVAKSHGWERFAAAQYQYSLVERNIEPEFSSLFAEEEISQVPWGPLGGGFLTGKYRANQAPPEGSRIAQIEDPGLEESWENRANRRNWEIISVVDEISEETGYSFPQIALAWLLEQKTVVSPIVGVRTMEQLEDNLGAVEVDLTPNQLARLNEVSEPETHYPYGFIKKYTM